MKQVLLFIINNWEIIAVFITIGVLIAIFTCLMLKLRDHLMEKVVYHRTFSDIGAYEGEHLYLVELREVVLHIQHYLIELMNGASLRQ